MPNNATRNVSTTKKPRQKLTVIIPAAGAGTRMKSYGPKCLLRVDGMSILHRQIAMVRAAFQDPEIIVVGGFEALKIRKQLPDSVTFVENPHFEHTNVVYSISLGMTKASTRNILVVYGDLVFNSQALDFSLHKTSMLVLSDTMHKDEVGCIVHDNKIENMMYDLYPKWSQIMYLTGPELDLFKTLVTEQPCSRMLGFEIINRIIMDGGIFKAVTPNNINIIDIDTSRDIEKAEVICTQ
tara:strand:- start:4527 stop:5243 length:717 start_codon:yes stop_codon:yes gene_type:complete